MQNLAWLSLAGVLGTLARYGLGGLVQRLVGTAYFPWGTFVINALGCLAFGVVWSLAEDRHLISSQTRIVLLIGFMGAFTTFSSFAFETTRMLQQAQWGYAAFNILGQNIVGVACVFTGIALVRWL